MRLPMLRKYVDEAVGVFSIFGTSPGGVDVSDGTNDTFTGLPEDIARKVVEEQQKFRLRLYALLCDKPAIPNTKM